MDRADVKAVSSEGKEALCKGAAPIAAVRFAGRVEGSAVEIGIGPVITPVGLASGEP